MDADERALGEELSRKVYTELRALAAQHLRREAPGHTLQPTALVHEAWLRLRGVAGAGADRERFLALASRTIRHILVDHARARRAQKRGGGERRLTLADDVFADQGPGLEVLALEEALEKLAELHPRQAQVVELRFFGGLEVAEVARALAVSQRTAEGDWTVARAWLRRELERQDAP
jgi:RNA polymerase sigma factor (TIGR02999 family)